MVSVIISSANAGQLKQVSANIEVTIGVAFEIIAIDNSTAQKSICAVYNAGAKLARYDILCFMHEDIIIKTDNWGAILKHTFDNNSEIGLLGVYGGIYKTFTPSGWEGLGVHNIYANIIQSYKHANKVPFYYRNPAGACLEYVACVDGVWLVTTKKIATEIGFDEINFTGFHCYDFDFSIAVGKKYKVAVTYDILLNHLSEGSYTRDWMEDNLKLHNKWKGHLPINAKNLSLKERAYIEKTTFKIFIGYLVKFKFPMSVANDILKDKKYRELGLYWKLKYYMLKLFIKG